MVSYLWHVRSQHLNVILVPLGAFDGRVAAVHPHYSDYYIATPNQEHIFAPHGHCNLFARMDGRYGVDDHTQWPQPFSRSAPYLCCVPQKDALASEYSIMWWNPTRLDFEPVHRHGWNLGIGFLPHHELQAMEQCCEQLNERAVQAKVDHSIHYPETKLLSVNLRRSLSRLRAVAMARKEVLFECRQIQRLWMELWALLDYIEIFEPYMEGRVPPATETAKVIGCFVHNADVAERLFAAGIPYWFIRPISSFVKENILSITSIVQPKDKLELEDYVPYPFPRIYVGDSNYNRFQAISEHGLKSLRYTDLFSDGNRRGIKPHEFEQAGPSRYTRDSHTRYQPCKLLRSANFSTSYMQTDSRSGKSGPKASTDRDKFEPIDSPYMPLALQSWQSALSAVDRDPKYLYYH